MLRPETLAAQLRKERDQLSQLNPTLSHCLQIASEQDLLEPSPGWAAVRAVPSTWGARCDGYLWDRFNWAVRGSEDLAAFGQIAERIGGKLRNACCEGWNSLLPGTYAEVMGTKTNLFLADYWMLTVHHIGWQGLLPYECPRTWDIGHGFEAPFRFVSQLGQTLLRASLDALTLLMDALTLGPEVLEWPTSPTKRPTEREHPWSRNRQLSPSPICLDAPSPAPPRKREKRVTDIDDLTREFKEHLRLAQDTVRSAIDMDRDPRLLPRPSKRDLGKRVGLPEYAVTRCFQDPLAKELNVLYEGAEDLEFVMRWRG